MFADQLAVVMGGGSGVGAHLSRRLREQGANVVVVDIDANLAKKVSAGTVPNGKDASWRQLDASDAVAVDRFFDELMARHPRLDYVFNCAGLGFWGDARLATTDDWEEVFAANLWSVIYPSLAAYRIMGKQRQGSIVNVASLAGLLPVPSTIPYTSAKHGAVGFSLALRAEAAVLGVQVNLICPGPISTEFHQRLIIAGSPDRGRTPPTGSISVDTAVERILRAVAKNRRITVFPFRLYLQWKWAQWFPSSFARKADQAASRMHERFSNGTGK